MRFTLPKRAAGAQMKRKLSIRHKNKKQAKVPPRITNETVAEHREQIIAGGRKFKYPIQYARHRLVFNAIIIAILGAFLLLVAGWVLMYPMQNSSGVAYRISRVIPLPVGSINGEAVLYSDYLASYRSSAYYLKKNPEVRLKNDGQVQLNHIKRQSLDLAERVAYARQLARQHNISISDSDVDTVIERERITANGRVSQDTYDASIKMLFGESANDYRFRTANAMLESRVAFAVDVKAKQQIEAVMAALKQGKSFDEAVGSANALSGGKANAGKSGLIDVTSKFNGLRVQGIAGLKKDEISGIMQSATTDGYYIVKITEKTEKKIAFDYVHVPLQEFTAQFAKLKADGKIQEYISVPESQQP